MPWPQRSWLLCAFALVASLCIDAGRRVYRVFWQCPGTPALAIVVDAKTQSRLETPSTESLSAQLGHLGFTVTHESRYQTALLKADPPTRETIAIYVPAPDPRSTVSLLALAELRSKQPHRRNLLLFLGGAPHELSAYLADWNPKYVFEWVWRPEIERDPHYAGVVAPVRKGFPVHFSAELSRRELVNIVGGVFQLYSSLPCRCAKLPRWLAAPPGPTELPWVRISLQPMGSRDQAEFLQAFVQTLKVVDHAS